MQRKKLHFSLADTGWAKALWGKLYGQWLCEAPVFVYDFNVFDPHEILSLIEKYKITTFCAPSTMYRLLGKVDVSKYDISSLQHITSAGESLSKEVIDDFYKVTKLIIHEGFGQTETTLLVGNMYSMKVKLGSMGIASPMYDVVLVDNNGKICKKGEIGEIAINVKKGVPNGLCVGYYISNHKITSAIKDGLYRTKDMAYQDEEGYFYYVGRVDDIIKSAGYRIGPIEIENVINQLPFVRECAVTSIPDSVRGKAIKAIVVLNEGIEQTKDLRSEIGHYLRVNVAAYKWPKVIEFTSNIPKTSSGKIKRCEL